MKNELYTTKAVITGTEITRTKVLDFLKAFGLSNQLSPQEADQFISIAQEFQLNPFKREIHCVPYGEGQYRKLSIVIGYETYIKRAERTGKLDGWKAWTEGEGEVMKAVVEIHRKDWHQPFKHEVPWTEAAQRRKDGTLTPFWQRMPCFQLKKVAISQAFRLAFPDELGGMPYSSDELGIGIDQHEDSNLPTANPQNSGAPSLSTAPQSVDTVQNEPQNTQDETGRAPLESDQSSSPEESPAYIELEEYLKANEDKFTTKHLEWIRAQVEVSHTPFKAEQMFKYARRIVSEKAESDGDPYNMRRYRQFTTSPASRSPITNRSIPI